MRSSTQFARARFIRFWLCPLVTVLRYLAITAGLLGVIVVIGSLVWPISSALLALAIFLLSPLAVTESVNLFVSYLRDHPEFLMSPEQTTNPFNRLDFASQQVLSRWRDGNLGGLLRAFSSENETATVLLRFGLVSDHWATLDQTPLPEESLRAILAALPQPWLTVEDFLQAILSLPPLQAVLQQHELDPATINTVIAYYSAKRRSSYQTKAFWLNHLARTGGIGKDWAVSYTPITDAVTSEVPPSVRQRALYLPLFSRTQLLTQISQSLGKTVGQNLLLVGETGVGKTELFHHLASQVLFYQTKTELDGANCRVLDVGRLLAAATSADGLQRLLEQLFAELGRAGNIILYISPLDALLTGGKLGQADLSAVLSAHLSSSRVHIVGATSPENYVKLIKPNQLLNASFSVIEVPSPSADDLLAILLSHCPRFENRYHVFFTVEALRQLIYLASRYVKDEPAPQRELSLMETIAATAHAHSKMIITAPDVTASIEQKAQVPIQVAETEQQTLLNLPAALHQQVIGQDRAIQQISDALLRARSGLSRADKPIGSFLFLGPTGVGKTETAKALARTYFGGLAKLITLDMTEYADSQGLAKLLGTDQVNDPGALTVAVQKSPSAVLLFDEFEKAAAPVKNVLLQLLDEGRLTTNYSKVLDFTNMIVIATSNAGSDYIKAQIEAGTPIDQFEKVLTDRLIAEKVFSPELLNRFDDVIVFTPLSSAQIEQVVGLQLASLKTRLEAQKGLILEVAPAVVTEIARRGYDPVFGARALERVMKNDLETAIAKQIIAQQPQPGTTLKVDAI